MKKYLLPESGSFYKANLHMHTNISDGTMTPEEVKEEYMKRGYSIVAFTDHEAFVPHNDLTDDNFIAINSYEIATNDNAHPRGPEYRKTYHMNLYAKDPTKTVSAVFTMSRMWPAHAASYMSDEAKAVDFPREYSVESMNEVIAKASEDGFLVSFNHPVWSINDYNDYAGLKGVWGVEYYNTGCVRAGYPDTMQPIDDLMRLGERVFPLAADDAHAGKDTFKDCFGGWVMIKADALEYGKIMTSLETGDFYASSGPEIKELYIEDNVLHIVTSEAVAVEVTTDRRRTYRKNAKNNEPFTEAKFDLSKFFETSAPVSESDSASYFRITVISASGDTARTRGYFYDEF